jgi:hypothetical protein
MFKNNPHFKINIISFLSLSSSPFKIVAVVVELRASNAHSFWSREYEKILEG